MYKYTYTYMCIMQITVLDMLVNLNWHNFIEKNIVYFYNTSLLRVTVHLHT